MNECACVTHCPLYVGQYGSSSLPGQQLWFRVNGSATFTSRLTDSLTHSRYLVSARCLYLN